MATKARVIDVCLYTDSEKQSILRHVTLDKDLGDDKLSDVRRLLVTQLEPEQRRLPFCTDVGGSVSEDTKFSVYSSLLKEGHNDSNSVLNYKVFLKKENVWTGVDEKVESFLQDRLDLAHQENKVAQLKADPRMLKSSFDPSAYTASAPIVATHPADMTEKHWNVVMRTNKVLTGQRFVDNRVEKKEGQKPRKHIVSIERGSLTGPTYLGHAKTDRILAFELAKRKFEPYQISYSDIGDAQNLAIPRFDVTDDSSVDVYETKTSLESALAKSSFSETVVEASAGGGAFGMSLGVKLGYSQNASEAEAEAKNEENHAMHISYNFPRVVLHLEPDFLRVSEDCKQALEKIEINADVEKFYERFGRFFAKRVELGGRLHSEQQSSSFGEAKTSEKAQSMKAAASVSFSSSFFQASASASHEKQSKSNEESKKSEMASSISWEASGGDTLLCNNPAAWCPTVASFKNWRIIKQDDLCPITEILGMMDGYRDVPFKFARASKIKRGVEFRLKVVHEHNRKIKDKNVFFALSERSRPENLGVSVQTAKATPYQQHTAQYITNILQKNTLARLINPEEGGEYFEAFDENFNPVNRSVEHGKRYRFFNLKHKRWLSVTQDIPGWSDERVIFGGDLSEASIFRFGNAGTQKTGAIEDDDKIELYLEHPRDKGKLIGNAMLLDMEGVNATFNDIIGVRPYSDGDYVHTINALLQYGSWA